MLKYLLAIVVVLALVGLVWFRVHPEHPIVAPPAWTEPTAPVFSGPPVVPVEPEPAPAPVPHKPARKHVHIHHKHLMHKHAYYFHGQRCAKPWIVLPGSVTCMPSGLQFLPDELEWSVPR